MRNLLLATIVATFTIGFAFGCSDDEAASPENAPAPDPTVGPAPPAAPPPGGAIPPLNLPPDAAPPVPLDAGPDVQPVDVDPGAASGKLVYAVDTDGRMISFRVNAPDKVSVKLITGLQAGEKLVGIDFRPADGKMYGLGSSSRLYTVDRATGAATVVGDGAPFTPPLAGQAHGFDVNPAADKIRVHTDVDQNLRLDPVTGKVVAADGALAFATGDANFGQSPNIVGTAYTNSVSPAPTTTTLYGIDSTRDLLVLFASPNDGQVMTLGSLGVDVDEVAGFDINGAGNLAYGIFRVGKEVGFYTVDIPVGTAVKSGTIVYPLPLVGMAIEP